MCDLLLGFTVLEQGSLATMAWEYWRTWIFWPSPSKIILFITILAMKTTINQNCHFFLAPQEKLSGLKTSFYSWGFSMRRDWNVHWETSSEDKSRGQCLVFAWLLSTPATMFFLLGFPSWDQSRVRTKLWDQVSPCARNFFTRLYVWEDPWGSGDPRLPFTWERVLEVRRRGLRFLVMNPGGMRLFGLFCNSDLLLSVHLVFGSLMWGKGKAFGTFACAVFTLIVFSSLDHPVLR